MKAQRLKTLSNSNTTLVKVKLKKWGAADGSKSKIQIQHLLKLN